MNIEKQDILQLMDGLSEEDLRIVYTFIQEYQIATMEDNGDSRYASANERY